MAFTLVVVVGPGTRAGQAAWALGGSGHVEGVSLGRGRKARCGGPRDAGWARQKPWSQQTLVSPRLWLKGNQMLPAPCLFPWSPACPPPGPPSVPLLPGLSVSALRLSSRSPSVLPALRPSSRPSVRPPSPCPSVPRSLPGTPLSLPTSPEQQGAQAALYLQPWGANPPSAPGSPLGINILPSQPERGL